MPRPSGLDLIVNGVEDRDQIEGVLHVEARDILLNELRVQYVLLFRLRATGRAAFA